MKQLRINFRNRLLLFTAFTFAGWVGAAAAARAQTTPVMVPDSSTPAPVVVPGDGAPDDLNAYQIQTVKIIYQKLLLKEKDIPNAISHVTKQQIQAEGKLGSVQSVLRQSPSVNEYQSGPGQGVPVLTIRGVRLYELTETLDGTPMTDILYGGQGAFLNNNIGSPVNLDQLDGVTIFPGVAPPSDQGFGSGGGTIAYQTKSPTAQRSAEVFGSYGSFNTSDAGFELNTGSLNGEADGARALLRYDQGYTDGFIDYTNERNQSMLFKLVKPYDGGLSKVSLTVIYNRGFGYINTAPLPTDLIAQNGYAYNFPKSLTFSSENNRYLTAILHDETYVNPNLILSGDLFYVHTAQNSLDYQLGSSVSYNAAFPYQITFQIPYFAYGPVGATAVANGVATAPNAGAAQFTYDPYQFAPAGSDPTDPDSYTYGESAELVVSHSNTIGFQPKANIFLPYNNITLGALIAKESEGSASYMYGSPNVPQTVGNAYVYGGGSQRTVYQAFVQDKIDILDNTLHIQPGLTVASAFSSNISQFSFDYPPYKLANFDVIAEPYIGVSYDFPHHVTGYASYGKGADFASLANYSPETDENGNIIGTTAPKPEIIHLYEAGLRYDTGRLYVNADAYYQKITSADSFFTNYQTGQTVNGNDGAEQFRGEELALEYRVTPALSFFGNTSFNQSNYLTNYFALDTPFEDQFGYVFKGDPLASVPNWLANFGLSYNHGNFGARLTEEYTGQQFITYDIPSDVNPTLANVTNNPSCDQGTGIPNECLALATVPGYKNTLKALLSNGAVPYIKQPGFLISNLLLTYDLPVKGHAVQNLHFELNIQNLLDVHYQSHLFNAPAEIPQGGEFALTPAYYSAFYGPPRSFTVNVSAKF
jgi:iron complex outermembrane receptor protein